VVVMVGGGGGSKHFRQQGGGGGALPGTRYFNVYNMCIGKLRQQRRRRRS